MNRLEVAVCSRFDELVDTVERAGLVLDTPECQWFGGEVGVLIVQAQYPINGELRDDVFVVIQERWEYLADSAPSEYRTRYGCVRREYVYQAVCGEQINRGWHLDERKPEGLRSHYHAYGRGDPRVPHPQIGPAEVILALQTDVLNVFGY